MRGTPTGKQTGARNPRTRRFLIWLGVITLGALALRLAVCAQLSGIPSVVEPAKVTDMATYRRIALEILDGKLPAYFEYQPFYYAVFLPLVYGLFGAGPWGLIVVQSLLGAASVGVAGLLAARCFGRRAGLIAAGLLALARFHVFHTPFALLEILQGFWMVLLAYLAVRSYRTNSWWRWLLTALVVSAATLTRGNALLLVPGVLALFAWRNRRSIPRLASGTILLALLVYLPQLPFAVRNYHYYGRWTGPASAQDAVLALGNTPEAPAGGLAYPPTWNEWMRFAGLPPGERTPVSRQMLRWFRQEPLAYLELKFRMLLLFWDKEEVPNNVVLAYDGRRSPLLMSPLLLDFAILGALGVWGLLLRWRWRRPQMWFLYYMVAVFCLGTVLFYILGRFRLPLVPLLCAFGGAAVDSALRQFLRSRQNHTRRGPLLWHALALCLGLFATLRAFPLYQLSLEKSLVRTARPHGVLAVSQNTLTVYDHGPLPYGGWSLTELPETGACLVKTFCLPPGYDAGALPPDLRLRIPVQGTPGAQLGVGVGPDDGQAQPQTVTLGSGREIEWIEMAVAGLAPRDGRVRVKILLRPVSGKVGIVLDHLRDYGRTETVDSLGRGSSLGAELAAELVLPRPLHGASYPSW
ncbi:MAG: hypothetical protein A3K19_26255 [Lentisphaerae bacterium RIFOXYB12_FULL_65_16]|nr:MAG: hypothetical protein A3K18_29720 [Lentisphaerae bacterium RIFOXYA12_64_32]OGV87777.1 MAG: hypothetical protein A3K19_26255 [Lentisphaerae bacterium RIFOXYB12_FULL_65_16]